MHESSLAGRSGPTETWNASAASIEASTRKQILLVRPYRGSHSLSFRSDQWEIVNFADWIRTTKPSRDVHRSEGAMGCVVGHLFVRTGQLLILLRKRVLFILFLTIPAVKKSTPSALHRNQSPFSLSLARLAAPIPFPRRRSPFFPNLSFAVSSLALSLGRTKLVPFQEGGWRGGRGRGEGGAVRMERARAAAAAGGSDALIATLTNAVQALGRGFDVTSDARLLYCKGAPGSRLVLLDDTRTRSLVIADDGGSGSSIGQIVLPDVLLDVKICRERDRREPSRVCNFQQAVLMERTAISDKLFTLSVGDRWHWNFCCGCCCTNLLPWIIHSGLQKTDDCRDSLWWV
uniref:Uncharacterized protein n=1 Tax=Musa acuminata TaxID=4641 RepID=Q1ENV4_MUSAC|nr:hypothetical protein MA4_82I11.24 [Musa acuminata]